ncbi:MAG: patatin-like phospholipase family protein [Aeromicrobium sp.]|nr:patatin-like phospholipase family protein [Burkholderiales bacterium]
MTTKESTANATLPNRIVLVLQGGGALGAYQAGVYQALQEHNLAPNWVVGTSIGAINAAIIAGNFPENRVSRLRAFWDRVAQSDSYDMNKVVDTARKFNTWLSTVNATVSGIKGFFAPRKMSLFPAGLAVAPEEASYYDTAELAVTLNELIDFDYLNAPGGIRLSVNAVKVTQGTLVSFDSLHQPLGVNHIMASGALPPGFPPVRIDGDLYWDGGLYSNTPLETVLDDKPPVDTLCFMVDLWSADGPEPTTSDEVQTRQKDVMFASRSTRHIESYVRLHNLQRTVRTLYNKLPAKLKSELGKDVLAALGHDTTLHIVRLEYGGQDWHMAGKDINFSKGSIEWRWEQGYRDATRGIAQAGWLAAVKDQSAIVVHELGPRVVV